MVVGGVESKFRVQLSPKLNNISLFWELINSFVFSDGDLFSVLKV